jgi:hypothetical protein
VPRKLEEQAVMLATKNSPQNVGVKLQKRRQRRGGRRMCGSGGQLPKASNFVMHREAEERQSIWESGGCSTLWSPDESRSAVSVPSDSRAKTM